MWRLFADSCNTTLFLKPCQHFFEKKLKKNITCCFVSFLKGGNMFITR